MNLASIVDHTLLATDATRADIDRICKEADEYSFASVCVSPIWVKEAAKELKDSKVNVCTVIGFPQGVTPSSVKAFETKQAIEDGADEVDMVITVGKLKAGEYDDVEKDIKAVVDAANGKLVKVIIECCLLTDDEKVKACELAKKAGADFVKTSTGFSKWGAKPEDVALMRKTVGKDMGVKASGGIHTKEEAEAMVNAGANRIGASHGMEFVEK
ncbi:MAG: deoxyribose-phosphate aldolase [Veillonellaceae bacterium]|nr:deoxyribose-phosphate aldolase [Veillonellaceae bacterium]